MVILGYIRLSTEDQNVNKALERQRELILDLGVEPTNIYEDILSGKDDTREGFNQILNLIKSGSVERLIVERCDRLSRNLTLFLELINLLQTHNVKLYEIYKGRDIDLSNPHEWYDSVSAGARADFESRQLSKRILEGYKFLRKKERANPRIPFGFLRVNHKYQIDPQLHESLLDIIDHFLNRSSSASETSLYVRETLGTKANPSWLITWLKNPVLRGYTYYKPTDELIKTHDPLIDEETYQLILQKIDQNKRPHQKLSEYPVLPLSGLCYCSECGFKLKFYRYAKTRIGEVRVICRKVRHGKVTCTVKGAPKADFIEARIIQEITQRAEQVSLEVLSDDGEEAPKSLEELKLLQQIKNLIALNDPDLQDVIDLKRQQLVKLKNKVSQESQNKISLDELKEILSIPDFWQIATDAQKREIYHDLVKKVVVDIKNKTCKVMLNF